jgi:hypothetical protein
MRGKRLLRHMPVQLDCSEAPTPVQRDRDGVVVIQEYHLSAWKRIKSIQDRLLYPEDDFRHYRTLWEGVYGWLNENQGRWLFEMASSTTLDGDIVEIGSAYGRSTVCLAWGARLTDRGKVYAVDPHIGGIAFREQLGEAKDSYSSLDGFLRNIIRFGLQEWVDPAVMTSEEALRQWTGTQIRLLFVDGWHTYDAVRHDIVSWAKHVISGGVIAMHDYQHQDVSQAIRDSMVVLGINQAGLRHIDANMVFFKLP